MTIPIDFIEPIWSIKVPTFPQDVAPLKNTAGSEDATEQRVTPGWFLHVNPSPRNVGQYKEGEEIGYHLQPIRTRYLCFVIHILLFCLNIWCFCHCQRWKMKSFWKVMRTDWNNRGLAYVRKTARLERVVFQFFHRSGLSFGFFDDCRKTNRNWRSNSSKRCVNEFLWM